MKKYGLVHQIRKSAEQNRIWTPGRKTQRSWPLCMTCGSEVEATELKNANSHSVELWARCHGAEDYYTIEFPYQLDAGDPMADPRVNDHIKSAMLSFTPFDPTIPKK